MSRNKREGRYAGFCQWQHKHVRTHSKDMHIEHILNGKRQLCYRGGLK